MAAAAVAAAATQMQARRLTAVGNGRSTLKISTTKRIFYSYLLWTTLWTSRHHRLALPPADCSAADVPSDTAVPGIVG